MSAKEIFLKAVENYKPEDWPVFLDGACGDNAELRQEVEELLKAHQQQDSRWHTTPDRRQRLGRWILKKKYWPALGFAAG